jgi:putative transposase
MHYNKGIHHRRSIRLKNFDYSQAGAYFVTICSWKQECLLGELVDGQMLLNQYGEMVKSEWLETGNIRSTIQLDKFIVMPNHIHGILKINNDCRGMLQRAPTYEQFGKPVSNSLPTIIRLFKSTTTKRINTFRITPGHPVWQRNYYEHVIRDDEELNHIREYIMNNPLQWVKDENNPVNIKQ